MQLCLTLSCLWRHWITLQIYCSVLTPTLQHPLHGVRLRRTPHSMEQLPLRMGRMAGILMFCCLKLLLLLRSMGPVFSGPSAGGTFSCTSLACSTSSLDPLSFLVFLAFSLTWGSAETQGGSLAPSGGGRVSWGRSRIVGLPSTCSLLETWRSEVERLPLVQVELAQKSSQIVMVIQQKRLLSRFWKNTTNASVKTNWRRSTDAPEVIRLSKVSF